ILRLELVEQARVLDGDDRLVGKGLEQGDLLLTEWSYLEAPYCDGADGAAFSKQRNADEGSRTFSPRDGRPLREFVGFGLKVGDVDVPSLDHGAPIAGSWNKPNRADIPRAVMGDGSQEIALDAIDDGVEGLAEPGRAQGDRVEHGLHVGR